jgi:hypothetical protein
MAAKGERKAFPTKAFELLDPLASLHPPVKGRSGLLWVRLLDPLMRRTGLGFLRAGKQKVGVRLLILHFPPGDEGVPGEDVTQSLVCGFGNANAGSHMHAFCPISIRANP